ncbi:hypothetical protein ACP4OV_028782 [Aristida adscensionis]
MATGVLFELAGVAAAFGCVALCRGQRDGGLPPRRPRPVPRRRRRDGGGWAAASRALALLPAVLLAANAALLLSVADSTVAANRAVVSYVESAEMIRSLEPMQMQGTHDEGQISPGAEARGANEIDPEPPIVDDLMDNTNDQQEASSITEKASPPPSEAEASPAAGWRTFSYPSDHVLLLGCSGDEFTVRIMPHREGVELQNQRLAGGDLPGGCLRPEFGTLSLYNRLPHYHALFWALPGEEQMAPVALKETTVEGREVAPAVEEAPEAFVLSANVVAFLRPRPGWSEIDIVPHTMVWLIPMSTVEQDSQALRTIDPRSLIYASHLPK